MTRRKITYNINTKLVADWKVGDVFTLAYKIEKGGGAEKQGIDRDLGLAAMWIRNELLRYHFNDIGFKHTVSDFYRMRKVFDEDFLQIHRLNYVTFYVLRDIFDWLDDRKMLVLSVKKYWKSINTEFENYQKVHRSFVEESAWYTVLDCTRLTYDSVLPYVEPLENAVRDYLIRWRSMVIESRQKDDITLLSKVYVGLLFCAALRNTRKNHFGDIVERYGFDMSADYSYSDIAKVGVNFVRAMGCLGIHFHLDSDGDYVPDGVDIAKSVRVDSEWNKIVRIVTDKDLMDMTALEAINLNPETKANYEAVIAKCDEKEMNVALGKLKENFKIGNL